MSRILFPAVVPAAIFLLISAPALAQDGGPLVIVVTPSGIEQSVDEANTTLTVIDQKTIEESNARSVAELLRGQAGVHVTDFFGDGSQATIDLRGFGPTSSSNTLVLVDGRRLNNSADTAAPDLSLIDIDDIAQIEILQGSSGVLYGNQAVGGVVNIIRKKSFEDSARISVSGGSYGARRLSASGNKVFGRNRVTASAADWSSDNYRDHNEAENQRLSLRAERIDNGLTSYIEAETIDDKIDTPGALLAAELDDDRRQSLAFYANDYFATETRMLRVGMSKVLDDARTLSFDFTNRDTEREFIQTFRPFPGSSTTQERDNKQLSASYQVVPVDSGILTSYLVGISRDETDYELVSIFGPQAIDQLIQDVYLSTHWSTGARGQIDAGVRYSDQQAEIADDDFDDSITVFSLGYSHSFEQVKLFARADQNFRYPTVEEHTSAVGPEPGLETQQGVSVEIGLEYRMAQNRIRGTFYRIDLENEIAFDSTGFNNLNLDQTRRNGLILEGARQWSRAIETRLSFTLLDAEITDGDFDGNQLPLVPERTLRLDGSYRLNPGLLFSMEIIAVDDQVFGGDFANELETLDAYEVVNAQVSYDYKNWVLGLRVNNLLDEQYSEIGNQFTSFGGPPAFAAVNEPSFFPSPERNFWLSAKVNF
ncbi:MAG: TonB-dependent receptor [Gammaproteobacteria bacterium]|jgi:iron complex outermembrane receptor protein|nr:TonB-dependent receptor [Gammaproteobacteria bacterium]